VEVPGAKRSWFVYVIELADRPGEDLRKRVRGRLQKAGIASQVYFPAIHRQPYFAQYRAEIPMPLANTESAGENCLAIPFSGRMTKQEIKTVCAELKNAVAAELQSSCETASSAIPA
jgi:dTDP-4-amino-4,6-dideoxygalactose transaminase